MTSEIAHPFLGGCLIGVAVTIMLLFNGKIAGNSGIVSGIWTLKRDGGWWRLFYLGGLILGTYLYRAVIGVPDYELDVSYPVIILAGLLVGFGTRLGGGCTSGHGICGMARLSKRSIVATVVFMLSGILTVFLVRQWTGGVL